MAPLFLTEVVFEVEESRTDHAPLLTIKRDTQQRNAGNLLLVNEGWCDLTDLTLSFQILPGDVAFPLDAGPPYPHSINMPLLRDHAEIDVTQAFQEEGVDVDGQNLLSNGAWDEDVFVALGADGAEERLTEAELERRWKECLGPFQAEVGTLAGEISFNTTDGEGRRHALKFYAPVYLANRNRMSMHKPPTYAYDVDFATQNTDYQRRARRTGSLSRLPCPSPHSIGSAFCSGTSLD